MKILINWLLSALAIFIAAYILNGFSAGSVVVTSLWAALVAALVLGIVNALIKPLLVVLTLPITVVTLGLFYLVINTLMVLLTAWIVPGFAVGGFWIALTFSVILSLVSWALNKIA